MSFFLFSNNKSLCKYVNAISKRQPSLNPYKNYDLPTYKKD